MSWPEEQRNRSERQQFVEQTASAPRLAATQVGVEIIQRAIRRPAKTIANNAGMEGDVIVGKLLERPEAEENVGYNAATGVFEDLVKAGVIDPIKVRACVLLLLLLLLLLPLLGSAA